MTRVSVDLNGTPGVLTETVAGAYWGLGWIHGFYRPMQTLLIATAGRGEMSQRLVSNDELVQMDALIHRHGIVEAGRRGVDQIPEPASAWLDAYLTGVSAGLRKAKLPWEYRLLATKIPPPDRASVVSSILISGFLGLAQSQERMERALVESVREGADPRLLETMFDPFLEGWQPSRFQELQLPSSLGSASNLLFPVGGSNAWALDGRWTNSGKPMLAGDPHLQISQTPGLFLETRAQVGTDYWLGATIPGLPGFAVGRNKHLAWAGTFGVADNVDFFIEEVANQQIRTSASSFEEPARRRVKLKRRFKRDLDIEFIDTPMGTLEGDLEIEGYRLSSKWSSSLRPWEAITSFLTLPTCQSSKEAERCLEKAHSLSLHFVTADTGNDVRLFHLGMLPERDHSGLYPVEAWRDPHPWTGRRHGLELPRERPEDGLVASANEARQFADGRVLSTLPQASYRLDRIESLLRERQDHGFDSMRAIQLDLYSLQAERLKDRFLKWLPNGPLRSALETWDHRYDAESHGAHGFELVYQAARHGLGKALGGEWFDEMIRTTELGSWWLRPIDRILSAPDFEKTPWAEAVMRAVSETHSERPEPWGQIQELYLPNPILDFLPGWTGFKRGPFPFEGGRATPCQAQLLPTGRGHSALGPAYRMVTDLAEHCIWTALPGGVSGNPLEDSSSKWLQEWLDGSYHRLAPPALDEAAVVVDVPSL